MKNYFLILFVIISFHLFSQENNQKLSFSFGYGMNTYSMKSLNEFFIDSFAIRPEVDLLRDYIKTGNQYQLTLLYQPNSHFDFGVYGSYQYGKATSKPIFIETNEYGFPLKEHRGYYQLRTEAVSIGIATTWYIDGLLKWYEKESPLNRFHFGIEINGGYGFSKVSTQLRIPAFPIATSNDFFTSRDFQGQFGIKTEYDFTKSSIFTTLGFRFGYQYFKTKTVVDSIEQEWIVSGKYPINLDFSGFYFGIYLKIGK